MTEAQSRPQKLCMTLEGVTIATSIMLAGLSVQYVTDG